MKKRRSFLQRTALAILGLGAMSFKSSQKSNILEGPFVHIVFFWLKEPENEASRKKFVKEAKAYTENISAITKKHIGTPAATDRDVVDNTYTFSMVLTFDSKKDYDIYADHPLHLEFIERASELWERVQVYDSTLLKS